MDRFAQGALIAAFALLLALPLVRATAEGWRHVAASEMREAAPWPDSGSLPERARGVEAFFEDRLGFRGELLALHSWLRARVLRTQPNPQVLLGRDGWLFFNGSRELREPDRVVHQARGARRLGDEELAEHRAFFTGRQGAFAAYGVPYLLVFAPNKHTIYGEHLPPRMNRVGERTPLDQTLAMLAEETEVPVLDLRGPLRAAKSHGLVYYRTDSHWNALGAQVATGEILDALRPWLPGIAPTPLDRFEVRWHEEEGNTLARLIALPGHYRERIPTLVPPRPPRAHALTDEEVFDSAWFLERPKLRSWFLEQGLVYREYRLEAGPTDREGGAKRHGLFLVDSFGAWLMEPLAEHFATATFLHRRTPPGLVRRLVRERRPDVVVEEMVERSLVAE